MNEVLVGTAREGGISTSRRSGHSVDGIDIDIDSHTALPPPHIRDIFTYIHTCGAPGSASRGSHVRRRSRGHSHGSISSGSISSSIGGVSSSSNTVPCGSVVRLMTRRTGGLHGPAPAGRSGSGRGGGGCRGGGTDRAVHRGSGRE